MNGGLISELEIVDIDYLESYFTARFTLEMTWIDRRLTFQNLRVLDNVLDAHEIGKKFYGKTIFIFFLIGILFNC